LGVCKFSDVDLQEGDRHLSYLPLAHIFEKVISWAIFANGGVIGFYGGDTLKLKDDMAKWKPTVFASVPRLYSKFYDVITAGMSKLTGIKKKISDYALYSKKYYLKNGTHYSHKVWDALVFNKIK
jgi:long-chain acyl-CoA synthetase